MRNGMLSRQTVKMGRYSQSAVTTPQRADAGLPDFQQMVLNMLRKPVHLKMPHIKKPRDTGGTEVLSNSIKVKMAAT